jgi:hypothetical protein
VSCAPSPSEPSLPASPAAARCASAQYLRTHSQR